MFESIAQNKENKFYIVTEEAIAKVQEELGIIFPNELKEFYKKVGYGFLNTKQENFNRIMNPESVCDFRFRKGQFSYSSDLDIYEDEEKDRLFFFEICEGNYLSIGFSRYNNGKIFYGDKEIANSLEEFLTKYQENERYFE